MIDKIVSLVEKWKSNYKDTTTAGEMFSVAVKFSCKHSDEDYEIVNALSWVLITMVNITIDSEQKRSLENAADHLIEYFKNKKK